MNDVLICSECHSKNRVQRVPGGQVPVCARCHAALPWLHDGSDASFASDIQAGVPVLVDFWAPWCGPCRVMGPVLEEIAREQAGKVRVVKINVDENPQSAARFQVRSIPTLLIFRDGEAVDSVIGAVQKSVLLQKISAASGARLS
ncbi:thioredoxin TrxC [Deinococcus aerophilus]|uniref:Thioredoxin n=1 Tax=Deinococcus aerophilus TaxID=522488 RepID=A0ABQ2GZC5_9DEIO|nr:thioredoxin TrxC [Deinococcus aerophilus]GGM21079.1 thiol reductase thioredoxin [Deinococcus aerophilus]